MRKRTKTVLSGAAIVLAAAACSEGTGGPEAGIEKEILVAHFVSECVGVGPQQCLNVRESADDDWTLWYDPIDGFEHEAGYVETVFRLDVAREDLIHAAPAGVPVYCAGGESRRRSWSK